MQFVDQFTLELRDSDRTQELLAARGTDGGEQLFTRANDFGYSKHPDETLNIWNKDEVLADVVKMIITANMILWKNRNFVLQFNSIYPTAT